MSLSAPTDIAKKAMEELGLEVFDANGKLRPLNETFQDLNGKLGEMSDEDRINVLNTMFNKVDLKSVNALLANSGERFDELSGYIRDSAGAAEDMAKTMNDNLKGKLTILGSALEGLGIEMYEEFQQPLKEAAETAIKSVDSISASLKNGKLSESMASVARGIGTIVSKVAELAIGALPKLIDGFAFLVDHAKLLGTVLASTAGAVVTFKSTMLINDIVKSWNAAATAARMFGAGMTSSLTGAQAVVGGLTGNISKLGAVTAALGGPMGVAALAVAGVTAGIVALSLATDEEAKQMKEWQKSSEEMTKELENRQSAWEDMQETSRKQISLNSEEIDSTKELIDELGSLVDENGKVGESKERVKYITDKINELAPDSIKWVDGETIAYQKEADAIKKALDQKKAKMTIDELQDDRNTAQKGMTEALEAQVKLREEIAEKEQALAEKRIEQSKATRDVMSTILEGEVKDLENSLAESQKALEQNIEDYEEYAETIDNINKAEEAYTNGHYDEVARILGEINLAYKDARTASIAELQQQSEELQAKYDALVDTVGENSNEVAQKVKEDIKNLLDETNQELKSRTEALAKQMEQSGINAVLGFARGLRSNGGIQGAINASISLGTAALSALNKSLDERSPSKETEKSGKYFDEGMAIGIEKNKSSVIESVEDLAESSLATAREQAEEYKDIGDLFGENYLAGLEEKLDSTTELIEKNTDKTIKAYEKAIDEETESVIQKREEQTDAEVEALQEQISKLKDVKDKGQKEVNKAEIKELEKQIKLVKENGKEHTQTIKDNAKEQKDAYKKGMQEIEKAGLDVIKKATNDIEKEYESRKDSIVEEYQSQKDAILSLQDDLYSKTSEYGELFHYDDETGELLLNDLTKNTQAVNQYYDSLEKLSNIEGISDSFVKMIATEYDVEEGTKVINELLRMSDTRLQAYASEWDKLQEVSSQRSKQFLDDELSVIDTSFNQAMDKLKTDLPEITRQVLADSINEIATVFPEKYTELIQLDPEFFNNMLNTLNAEILGNLTEQKGIVVPIKAEAENFPEKVTEQIPGIQEAGSEATVALGEQIGKDGKKVVTEADDVGEDTVRALESHEPEFQQIGEEYMDRLIAGMQSKWDTAVNVAHEIAESLKDELEDVASFSMRDTDDAMSARSLMESVEPAMISRLYNSMVDSIGFYQSRLAAASTSYITNNSSSRVENNMGDVNFNIAEVKGENADRSISKMMEQAEFYRRQKRLAVGVK